MGWNGNGSASADAFTSEDTGAAHASAIRRTEITRPASAPPVAPADATAAAIIAVAVPYFTSSVTGAASGTGTITSVGDTVRSAMMGVNLPSASGADVAACVVDVGGTTLDVLDARVVVVAAVVDASVVVSESHSVMPEPDGASD
jgi:hypothetical protein